MANEVCHSSEGIRKSDGIFYSKKSVGKLLYGKILVNLITGFRYGSFENSKYQGL